MKKIKHVNYKKIMAILLSGFVLTSCGNVENKEEVEYEETEEVEDNDEIEEYSENEAIEENELDEEVVEEEYSEEETDYNEEDVVSYLNNLKEDIKNSDKTKKAKEKSISSFITIVDFIFYGKEIHGITYDELSEEYKNNIMDTFLEVDGIIKKKFPDYKEKIGSKYDNVSDYLKEKYNDFIEKRKEGLSEETLEDIDNLKDNLNITGDDFKDTAESIYGDEKVKVKDWYEEFKNRNNN